MKISTKGRYALRMMCTLAANDNGTAIPLRDIAESQNISVKYLEQIVILLSRAGFVKKYYTVGMILRLTEGNLAPVVCLEDNVNTCERAAECETLYVWEKLYEAITNVVDNITVEDIITHSREHLSDNYVI